MKKLIQKLLFLLILAIKFSPCNAQNLPLSIKENFEKIYNPLVVSSAFNPEFNYQEGNFQNIPDNFGDRTAFILEGFIKMYETTGDKAYLIKIITSSISMLERRRDYSGVDLTTQKWCNPPNEDDEYDMYHDGNIIWVMSHFIYLIETENQDLINVSLPQFDTPTKINDNDFGITLTTYGSFAAWIRNCPIKPEFLTCFVNTFA